MRGRREGAARPPARPAHGDRGRNAAGAEEPLTEREAEAEAHGICFKTGPPGRVGVELEWIVHDGRDPTLPVDDRRVRAVFASLAAPGALAGAGRLTLEPGGQIELSSAPSPGLHACVTSACRDLAALRQAAGEEGLTLTGQGLDHVRRPRRILDEPRYAAMEEFFDRAGPWGRVMMCSTASVQVCLDAGDDTAGPGGFRWRWRLLHAIGPVMVAAFANSPLRAGRPTGWKSTRQAVWARLDPTRTRPPPRAEPAGSGRPERGEQDPRTAWVAYALSARVMCIRRPQPQGWSAPAGLTFRDWLRGAGERPPTRSDLIYHLSTLFPPVRPRGHLEFRAIDAQPGDGWIVPTAVVTALLDDPLAAQEAMAAAEPLWRDDAAAVGGAPGWPGTDAGRGGRGARRGASGTRGRRTGERDPWLRAARCGPADDLLAAASLRCFEAADAALGRLAAPEPVRRAVSAFAERYVVAGRCPADDRLDAAKVTGPPQVPVSPRGSEPRPRPDRIPPAPPPDPTLREAR